MKIAILTGANGNLGSNFLRSLRELDYFIYAVDKEIGEIKAEEFVESVQLDITDEKKVKDFYSTISSLDLLVNNAGIGVFTPFEERTADEFKMVTDVNLLGTFLMAQGAVKIMKKQNFGKIVN